MWIEKSIIAVTLTLCVTGCTFVGNVNGESHKKATTSAHSWAKEMGFDTQGVICVNSDTNSDGYVSCTVTLKKIDGNVRFVPIECAAAYTFNRGCRIARIIPTRR